MLSVTRKPIFPTIQTKTAAEGLIGLAHTQGFRPHDQDSLAYHRGPDIVAFTKLPLDQQEKTLISTFKSLESKTKQQKHLFDYSGTNGCQVTAWLVKGLKSDLVRVRAANLGDSGGHLVILDEHQNFYSIEEINELHSINPEINPQEFERIKQIQPPYKDLHGTWRFGSSGLMFTRSFGDYQSEKHGLRHAACFYSLEVTIQKGFSAYIVIGCDGLTESDNLNGLPNTLFIGPRLASLVKARKKLETIAHSLTQKALENGSQDNITTAVFEVTVQPLSATVFDGHGENGHIAAYQLAKCVYVTLNQQMNMLGRTDKEEKKESAKQRNTALSKPLSYYQERGSEKQGIKNVHELFSLHGEKTRIAVKLSQRPDDTVVSLTQRECRIIDNSKKLQEMREKHRDTSYNYAPRVKNAPSGKQGS